MAERENRKPRSLLKDHVPSSPGPSAALPELILKPGSAEVLSRRAPNVSRAQKCVWSRAAVQCPPRAHPGQAVPAVCGAGLRDPSLDLSRPWSSGCPAPLPQHSGAVSRDPSLALSRPWSPGSPGCPAPLPLPQHSGAGPARGLPTSCAALRLLS